MELEKLKYKLTVCKVADIAAADLGSDFYFLGRTDEELSLVCRTEDTPKETIARDDGWRGFRIQGVLDHADRVLQLRKLLRCCGKCNCQRRHAGLRAHGCDGRHRVWNEAADQRYGLHR